MSPTAEADPRRAAGRVVMAAALALLAFTALAAARVPPFSTWYYHFAWYPTLVLLDAGLARREGRFPLLGRPALALSLWAWAVPVWLLFEVLNFRVANWYYVLAGEVLPVRRAAAILAFGTVLPAIYLGYRTMAAAGVARGVGGPTFRVGTPLRAALFATGVAFLGLALWRPTLFFPLIWGSVTLLLEPWNHRWDPARSLLGDLSRGRYGRILRLLAAGVGIGLLWELFNAFSETRWIYTVPGLETGKLFEMPVLGYLGFPVFALDCFVMYQALVNLGLAREGWRSEEEEREDAGPGDVRGEGPGGALFGRSRGDGPGGPARRRGGRSGRRVAGWAAAAAFAFLALEGVDRWTVDSFQTGLAGLPGAEGRTAEVLAAAGISRVRDLARADPEQLARAGLEREEAERLREAAHMALLRGMGGTNAAALQAAGIGGACDLAVADPEEVSRAVGWRRDDPHAGRPARVRVWIRAAERACQREAAGEEGSGGERGRGGDRRGGGEAALEGMGASA